MNVNTCFMPSNDIHIRSPVDECCLDGRGCLASFRIFSLTFWSLVKSYVSFGKIVKNAALAPLERVTR